jgi:type I restriction enzyme S subunit
MVGRWDLPSGWCWSPLGEVAEVVGGGTPSTGDPSNFAERGIPWITPADLSGYPGVYIQRGRRDISQGGLDGSGAKLLPARSVLFSSRAPIGYCVIAANEVSTSQGFKSLILKPDLQPEFVRYYLLASKDYAESLASGTTFKEVSGRKMAEMLVPVPPLDLQRRIVKKLDELLAQSRAAREQLEAVPALVETYRQSVLAAAYRGDLTAEWRKKNPNVEPASKLLERIRIERRKKWEEAELAKMKAKGTKPKDDKWKAKYVEPERADPSGLPELPATWAWAKLEELSEWVTDGTHQPPQFAERGVPFIVIGNIQRSGIDWSTVSKWVADDVYEEITRSRRPSVGDVLYTAVGSYGTAVAVDDPRPFCFQRHIAHVVQPRGVRPGLLARFLSSPDLRRRADLVARGNAQKTVTLGELRQFPVPIPPEAEQRAVERKLDAYLTSVSKIEQGLSGADITKLERTLLAKAFRGELELDGTDVEVVRLNDVSQAALEKAKATKRSTD